MEYVGWANSIEQKGDIIWVLNAYPRAYYYLGYLWFELGNFETALNFIDQGLNLDPTNPVLHNEKAQALVGLKRLPEALQIYEQIISFTGFVTHHNKAVALRGKGFIMIEMGNLSEAENAFYQSQKFEPDSELAIKELKYIQQLRN